MQLQRSLLLVIAVMEFCFVAAVRVNAGTIAGDVKFIGSSPKGAPIKVTKDQDYCGETLPNETYLIDANGGLKNVVVFIESAPTGKPADPQKDNFLYNDGCRYAPHVMAFQRGERLRATLGSRDISDIRAMFPMFALLSQPSDFSALHRTSCKPVPNPSYHVYSLHWCVD